MLPRSTLAVLAGLVGGAALDRKYLKDCANLKTQNQNVQALIHGFCEAKDGLIVAEQIRSNEVELRKPNLAQLEQLRSDSLQAENNYRQVRAKAEAFLAEEMKKAGFIQLPFFTERNKLQTEKKKKLGMLSTLFATPDDFIQQHQANNDQILEAVRSIDSADPAKSLFSKPDTSIKKIQANNEKILEPLRSLDSADPAKSLFSK